MIGKIVIGLLALLILVGGIVGGVVYWNKLNAPEPTVAETAIGDDALDAPETAPVADVALDAGEEQPAPDAAGETAAPEVPAATEEAAAPEIGEEVEVSISEDVPTEAAEEIQPDAAVTERSVPERPVERPSNTVREPRNVVGEVVDTTPVTTTAEGTSTTQGVAIEPVVTPTPTPAPTQPPAATPTPATPAIPKGNYAISTTTPVLSSQLPQVRKAMNRLGVQLSEQKGNQYPQQAYRVAIGYFVQKIEADNWAQTYLRPKKIAYQVYPVQGMYSIQVGVYTNRENVDRMISQLYQAFPGWRLPVRTEMTTIMQSTYLLSLRGIPETLARQIQSELYRLGMTADILRIS